jgi:prepilin-type N-terminal cleavage/methylation domain-containing protein
MTSVLAKNSGFSLFELLIVIAIVGILITGLQQVIVSGLGTYEAVQSKQELESEARFAMERILSFVQESDEILSPDSASDQEILTVSERVMDVYNNTTRAYDVDGDGTSDADNDGNGILNDYPDPDDPDPPDYITFDLDKTDGSNWKLRETMPDYGMAPADPANYRSARVLCEHVAAFRNNLVRKNDLEFSANLVEIQLTLNDGINEVSLRTRARARLLD